MSGEKRPSDSKETETIRMVNKRPKEKFSEGMIKKGGVNPKPNTPRPNVTPVGQKPAEDKPIGQEPPQPKPSQEPPPHGMD